MSIADPHADQLDGKPEHRWDERRQGSDRRSGLDRRGSGVRQALSLEPRPYGFREFAERRQPQDRRIYRADDGPCNRHGRENPADGEHAWVRSLLTDEEIRFLLRCSRPGRR